MLQTVNRIKALERMSTCGLSKKHTHQYVFPHCSQPATGLKSKV